MYPVRLCLVPLLFIAAHASAQLVVDFEDLALKPESAVVGDASQTPFLSNLVSFNQTWLVNYDCCPGAWAYSNQTDLVTGGVSNAYSAYALPSGGGVNGSANFGIATNFSLGEAITTLPAPTTVEGMYVTNTSYAYLAVADGNDGQSPGAPPLFVKGPFEAGDWFKLEIVGQDDAGAEIGRIPFYLADFRNGAESVIDDWTWVDLTGLGNDVSSLAFELSSTDNGDFGMNTPAYFAVDDLTLQQLPGDFDADFAFTCSDVDALVGAIAAGSTDITYDVNADNDVNQDDLTTWLTVAGQHDGGSAFTAGDANLDGNVDAADFQIWAEHKFSTTPAWCSGDFNASGTVDGHDFLIWNQHKDVLSTVPESGCSFLFLIALGAVGLRRSSNRLNSMSYAAG